MILAYLVIFHQTSFYLRFFIHLVHVGSGYSVQVKDNMRLNGVVKSIATLLSKLGMGELAAGWIIEEFTAQMRVVSKIALHRRSNLASFLESNGNV